MTKIESDAIILKVYDYSETSQIASLLSPEYGRLQVIAKGAKRIKSPFGGPIEPISRVKIAFVMNKKSTLATLAEIKVLDDYRALKYDNKRLYPALAGLELVIATSQEMVESRMLYDLLTQFLATVSSLDNQRTVLLAFLVQVLCAEGFAPTLDGCSVCGKLAFSGSRGPQKGKVFFHAPSGGIICKNCLPHLTEEFGKGKKPNSLSLNALKILEKLSKTELSKSSRIRLPDNFYLEIKSTLVYYVESIIERGLRVLDESGGIGGI